MRRGPKPMPRFPLGPLRRRIAHIPLADVAAMAGMSHEAIRIAVRPGAETISLAQADRIAIGLGIHPSELWPEWWDDTDMADG